MSYLLTLVFFFSITYQDIHLFGYIPFYRGYCINSVFCASPYWHLSAIPLSILPMNMDGVEGITSQ